MDDVIIDPFQFAAPGVFDADAADYITRVNAVDAANGASGGLEAGLQDIIHILFRDLKSDASPFAGVSNFAALKASCLLAGPRTRQGCAVPLLASMPTPSFQGTVGGWSYNRKNGLQGNGINNYLDSARSFSAEPRDNFHLCVELSAAATPTTTTAMYMGGQSADTSCNNDIYKQASELRLRSRADPNFPIASAGDSIGFIGSSRSLSDRFTVRVNSQNTIITGVNSVAPSGSQTIYVCARNLNGTPNLFSNATKRFYSIGEAVTLSTLNQRITAYMTALNALTLT